LAIHDQEAVGLDIVTDGENPPRELFEPVRHGARGHPTVDNPGTALDRSGHPNPGRASWARSGAGARSRWRERPLLAAHTTRPIR